MASANSQTCERYSDPTKIGTNLRQAIRAYKKKHPRRDLKVAVIKHGEMQARKYSGGLTVAPAESRYEFRLHLSDGEYFDFSVNEETRVSVEPDIINLH